MSVKDNQVFQINLSQIHLLQVASCENLFGQLLLIKLPRRAYWIDFGKEMKRRFSKMPFGKFYLLREDPF